MDRGRHFTLIVLVCIGIIGFTEWLYGYNDIEMAENAIAHNPQLNHMWIILGGASGVAILCDYVPKWIEKIRGTNLKRLISLMCTYAVIVLCLMITPIKDMEMGEQRIWIVVIVLIMLLIVWFASYCHNRSRRKKDGEDPPE